MHEQADAPDVPEAAVGRHPSFAEATRVWLRVAALSFGGPAGQIAVMHRILVEEKRWIGESRFLHALNYCMLLPGPEAQQLATYVGWLLHGTRGGLVAGTLFVLPGFLAILALSVLYAGYQELTLVQAVFFGIKAAVLAVVVQALLRIARRALRNRAMYAVAGAAFVAIFFLAVPFPLIVAGAAVIGLAGARAAPALFGGRAGHGPADPEAAIDAGLAEGRLSSAPPSVRGALTVAGVCLALWLVPVAALVLALGPDHLYAQEAVFFSKMAVVTFGGAYAVLAYVAQQAVEVYGWLSPGEMLDGLGMAETTPGPLIMVLQFVGFLGAYRDSGPLDPMLAGTLGAVLTTWVTFVPCFLWIFLGAPFVEALRGNRHLNAALSAITAAVVGVVLNLALWFALNVIFGRVAERVWYGLVLQVPDVASVDWAALALTLAALIAMLRFKVGMLATLAGSAGLGALYFMTFAA